MNLNSSERGAILPGISQSAMEATLATLFDYSYDYIEGEESICPCTYQEFELFEQLGYGIEFVGLLVIGTLGVLSNVISIPILLSTPLSNLFNQTLAALAIFDTIFILCDMLDSIRQYHSELTAPYHVFLFPHLLYPLQNIAMVGSIYTTVVVALERYIAVSRPFNVYLDSSGSGDHGDRVKWKKIGQYLGPVVIFAILFNLPTFFEFRVKAPDVEPTTDEFVTHSPDLNPRLEITPLRENPAYILFYINMARIPITGLFPLLALCILNYLVYAHLVRRRKSFQDIAFSGHYKTKFNVESRQAQTLFGVVLIFFLGHLLRVMLNLHEFLAIRSEPSMEELIRYNCVSKWPFWSMVEQRSEPLKLRAKNMKHREILLVISMSLLLLGLLVLSVTVPSEPYWKYISVGFVFLWCLHVIILVPQVQKSRHQTEAPSNGPRTGPRLRQVSRSVSRLLMTASSSANLLVYCAVSGIFRTMLYQTAKGVFNRCGGYLIVAPSPARSHSFSSTHRRSMETTLTSTRITIL